MHIIRFKKLGLSERRKFSKNLSMQLGCIVLMKIDEWLLLGMWRCHQMTRLGSELVSWSLFM